MHNIQAYCISRVDDFDELEAEFLKDNVLGVVVNKPIIKPDDWLQYEQKRNNRVFNVRVHTKGQKGYTERKVKGTQLVPAIEREDEIWSCLDNTLEASMMDYVETHQLDSFSQSYFHCFVYTEKGWTTEAHADACGSIPFMGLTSGRKTWTISPPTMTNMENRFMRGPIEPQLTVDLIPGKTLFLKPGAIHSVHTPELSMGVGGVLFFNNVHIKKNHACHFLLEAMTPDSSYSRRLSRAVNRRRMKEGNEEDNKKVSYIFSVMREDGTEEKIDCRTGKRPKRSVSSEEIKKERNYVKIDPETDSYTISRYMKFITATVTPFISLLNPLASSFDGEKVFSSYSKVIIKSTPQLPLSEEMSDTLLMMIRGMIQLTGRGWSTRKGQKPTVLQASAAHFLPDIDAWIYKALYVCLLKTSSERCIQYMSQYGFGRLFLASLFEEVEGSQSTINWDSEVATGSLELCRGQWKCPRHHFCGHLNSSYKFVFCRGCSKHYKNPNL